jgi:hypothetical protein
MVKHTGSSSRVVAQSSTSASLVIGSEVNHVVHVLLAIFTCGLWLPFWLIITANGGTRTRQVEVDQYGTITWT